MTYEDWASEGGNKTLRAAFEAGQQSIHDIRNAGQRFGEILAGTNDTWKAFGFLLRRYRQASNKTLADLSTEFGYTPLAFSDIERGKSKPFSLEEVRKISSYLERK